MKQAVFLLVMVGLLLIGGGVEVEQKVVFLDVGQGDAILLQDGNKQVLIDGGPGMKVLTRLGEEMPWMDRRIEVVILTHPQRDHMEGLLHVLERYEVGMILMPYVSNKSLMQEEWLMRISEKSIPHRFSNFGQGIEVGDIKIDVLGPMSGESMAGAIKSNVNNASTVVRVEFTPSGFPRQFGGVRTSREGERLTFLLTGDMEKRVEKMMVAGISSEALDVDVLKVGHHGSKTSTTPEMLEAVNPKMAVISVGDDNRFGHPTDEVLERLGDIPIWRTDERGSITFRWKRMGWHVQGNRVYN